MEFTVFLWEKVGEACYVIGVEWRGLFFKRLIEIKIYTCFCKENQKCLVYVMLVNISKNVSMANQQLLLANYKWSLLKL